MNCLIKQACDVYDDVVKAFPGYFVNGLDGVFPIVWFGDLVSQRNVIVTFGSNPSDKEFCSKVSRFPNSQSGSTPLPSDLAKDYNGYFNVNPYNSWFNSIREFAHENFHSNAECIHVDALPFATSVKYSEFKNISAVSGHNSNFKDWRAVLEWGRAFVKEVLGKIVNGNNVLGISVVGRTNFELFKEVFGNQFTYNVSKKNDYSVFKGELVIYGRVIPVCGTTKYLPNKFSNITAKAIANEIKFLHP